MSLLSVQPTYSFGELYSQQCFSNLLYIQGMSSLRSLIPLHLLETSAHSSDNCSAQIYIPWVHSVVIYSTQYFILSKNSL